MKRFLVVLSATILVVGILAAQPMSGSYTVGGTSPNFTTLQSAANAVKARGVSGPVAFNIRPGIYMENGGLNSVMILDSIIAGISPTNRLTFQPDEAAGGNVENVRLQINLTPQTSWRPVVRITVDHVSIRNVTIEDVDSAEVGADFLLSIDQHMFGGITQDIVIEGCRFIGNSHPTGGATYGTDYGISGSPNVANIVIRQNTFQRLMRSVAIGGAAGSSGSVIVEDNQFLNAHNHFDTQGTWIKVSARRTIVRRNYLDNSGGRGSIYGIVVQADSGLIERNTIKNGGGTSAQVPTFRAIVVDNRVFSSNALSMLVVNNMISGSASVGGWGSPIMGRYGIIASTKAQIIHNTIVHPYRQQISCGIFLDQGSDSSTVLNNIIVDYGSPDGLPLVEPIVLFKQYALLSLSGMISDYNVFFYNQPGVYLAAVGSNRYTTLSAYQAATGLDSNSIGKEVEFAGGDRYPHLSDCQAQDPQLIGIPYPGIVNDIDGDPRSLTAPTRGADEGRLRSTRMFGDVFRAHVSAGGSGGLAAGKFDNLLVDGLAVSDGPNNQVRLYHNVPSARSFYLSNTLFFFNNFAAKALRFFDLDHDGNLDVIAGGDTNVVKVFWGDGGGGFPQVTTVPTARWVTSIDTGRVSFLNLRTVVMTEASGLVPSLGFLCYLYNGNGRNLEHYFVIRPRSGGGTEPDTLWNPLTDIAVGDLDGNGSHEVAAPIIGGAFHVFVDTTFGNIPWGHRNIYPIPIYSNTYSSGIVMGRFSGGPRTDVSTASGHKIFVLRNQGSLNFSLDTIPSSANSQALASMDYDNDGDLDFVVANFDLARQGVSVFLNDGAGHFTEELNCYQNYGSNKPTSVVASDFDLDGRTDLAVVTHDSLFVLYNFGNVTGIRTDPVLTPTAFSLEQNYPNPFNPATTISFQLPAASHVLLRIYDLLGQEVATLLDEQRSAGTHTVQWNGLYKRRGQVSSGVYFYRVEARQNGGQLQFMAVKKMVLMK